MQQISQQREDFRLQKAVDMAQKLMKQKNFKEALEMLKGILDHLPEKHGNGSRTIRPQILRLIALAKYKLGNLEEAKTILNEVMKFGDNEIEKAK